MKNSDSDNKRLLVIRKRSCGKSGKYQFTALSPRDLSEIGDESFDLPFLYPREEISFNSYRDWICIYEYQGHIYLWNPTTKQCLFFPTKKLSAFDMTKPRTNTSLLGACVCYDSKSNEYKILRVCQGDFPEGDFAKGAFYMRSQTFELYSFREDSWSEIPFDNLEDIYMSGFRATSVRDKVYWFNLCDRIVSLDCSKKTLSYINLPPKCRPFELGELVQINGSGDSLGVVCMWDRHPKPGYDYELWVWSEKPRGWDRKFSVSLGGALGRPPGTIWGTFLFLCGMAGKPGDDEHRLVAYDWTKKDCKELGIHNYGFKIHVLCYVEATDVLPHGNPINGSSFLINPHFVKEPGPFINCDDYPCNCNCHFVGIVPGIEIWECRCSQPYTDAYKFDIEDFAANGFRILSDTNISKKQLAGNPDAQGGKKNKKKKEKKAPAQGNISRHDHLNKREGGSNICSDEPDPMEALLKSNEVSETFKQESDKTAKLIEDLKKENTIMKSKCDKSDVTLIELANECELLKEQLEKARNQKDILESVCRSLQAERKTNSAASNGSYSIPD